MKLYNTDSELPYKSTTISPENSKRDIDAILCRYGITSVFWKFDLKGNHVELAFQFSNKFLDAEVPTLAVRLKPPIIWKKRRGKSDIIDWRVSMRIFHWWMKNKLAMIYAMQSSPIAGFLPHIAVDKQTTVADIILPRLTDANERKALVHISFTRRDEQ